MSDDRQPPRRPGEDPEGVRIIGADEAEAAMSRDDIARRRGPDEPRPGDRPGRPPADAPEPVLRFPLPADEAPRDLPHWSDPPTGEYGAVGGGSIFDEPAPAGGDGGDWSSFSGGGPRWRDTDDAWGPDDDVRAWTGEAEAVGALDERQRDPDDYFAFDEYDQPAPADRGYAEPRPAPPGQGYESYDDGYGDDFGDDFDEFGGDYQDDPIVVGGGRVTADEGRGRGPIPAPGGRDMGQAVMYGAGLFLLALLAFFLGPAIAVTLVTIVVTASALEFFTKLRELGHAPAMPVGVAATAGMVLGAYHAGPYGMVVGMSLATVFSMLWFLSGSGETSEHGVVHNLSLTLFGTAWIGLLGSFAGALLGIRLGGGNDPGLGIAFGAILGTIGYDVGGLFIGQSAGRSPLSEASPNKTIEGLVGGILVALIICVGYGMFVEPFGSPVDGLKLGLAVAVAAPLGDLCQSMLKRDLGLKDMGAIIPGHGGLLDRFDGLLFVLPAVYFVARLSDAFL